MNRSRTLHSPVHFSDNPKVVSGWRHIHLTSLIKKLNVFTVQYVGPMGTEQSLSFISHGQIYQIKTACKQIIFWMLNAGPASTNNSIWVRRPLFLSFASRATYAVGEQRPGRHVSWLNSIPSLALKCIPWKLMNAYKSICYRASFPTLRLGNCRTTGSLFFGSEERGSGCPCGDFC